MPFSSRNDPDTMSTGEVARLFRVNSSTVIRWAEAGRLTVRRLPSGHRRYRTQEVHALYRDETRSWPAG